MGTIVDSSVAAGADRHWSRIYAASGIGSSKEASFVEVYGSGPIMADANLRRRNLNVRGLAALDPQTLKEDATPWNLSLNNKRTGSNLLD